MWRDVHSPLQVALAVPWLLLLYMSDGTYSPTARTADGTGLVLRPLALALASRTGSQSAGSFGLLLHTLLLHILLLHTLLLHTLLLHTLLLHTQLYIMPWMLLNSYILYRGRPIKLYNMVSLLAAPQWRCLNLRPASVPIVPPAG
jgi:hypothetical protein